MFRSVFIVWLVAYPVPLLSLAAQQLPTPAGATAHVRAERAPSRADYVHVAMPDETCDNSAMKHAESVKTAGKLAVLGGVAVYAVNWGPMFFGGPTGKVDGLVIPASAAILIGGAVASMAVASPNAWDKAVSSFTPGQSRTYDVSACLGAPTSKTSDGTGESWTYTALHTALFGSGSPALTSTLVFKNNVLVSVKKTESTR